MLAQLWLARMSQYLQWRFRGIPSPSAEVPIRLDVFPVVVSHPQADLFAALEFHELRLLASKGFEWEGGCLFLNELTFHLMKDHFTSLLPFYEMTQKIKL